MTKKEEVKMRRDVNENNFSFLISLFLSFSVGISSSSTSPTSSGL